MMTDPVKKFLKTQELLSIACADSNDVWIAKHRRFILENSKIAFNTAWFDKKNYANRKAVQGTGVCRIATKLSDVARGVTLHNKRFPAFANKITRKWIKTNEFGSRVWMIIPEYIKYWDDELYGDDEFEEMTVSRETT